MLLSVICSLDIYLRHRLMYPRLASIYQVAKNDLELMILQSLPLECWDCGFYYSL